MGEDNTSGERKPKKLGRVSAAVLPGVGLVAVLVGCVVAWSNASASVGWFAYAPLSNQVFLGSGVAFVSQGTQIGLASSSHRPARPGVLGRSQNRQKSQH